MTPSELSLDECFQRREKDRQRESAELKRELSWEDDAQQPCPEADAVMEQIVDDAKHGIYQAHDGALVIDEPAHPGHHLVKFFEGRGQ